VSDQNPSGKRKHDFETETWATAKQGDHQQTTALTVHAAQGIHKHPDQHRVLMKQQNRSEEHSFPVHDC
jgi:hypothetical protein